MSYKRSSKAAALALMLACAMLLAASCGYSIRQNPAISEVRIGKIRNMSFEPGLQDIFILSLERELTRQGIRVDRQAGYVLEGTINNIQIKGTAEDEDVTVQYEVTITGTFYLVAPGGKRKELRGRDNFIVSFNARGDLQRVMSSKEGALRRALDNLAADVASDVASARGVAEELRPEGPEGSEELRPEGPE
ncbi:MAG TPA: hypothetical protein ENI12_01740 [Nitrospirae bacterium]|nr:hypothetical protein [Nitrospirota bacterium]